MSDIYTVAVDSLKVLDPNRPIREADISRLLKDLGLNSQPGPHAVRTRFLTRKLNFMRRLVTPQAGSICSRAAKEVKGAMISLSVKMACSALSIAALTGASPGSVRPR